MRYKQWSVTAILILVLIAAGCSNQETISGGSTGNEAVAEPFYGDMFVIPYTTLEEVLEGSGAVVEVKKTGRMENVTRDHVRIALTEVKIVKVIMGDGKLDDRETIRIFELAGMNMTEYDKENDHYLLFLHRQNSNLGEDVYAIAGVYQGLIKVKNGKLIYEADKYGGHKHAWHEALNGTSIKEAGTKIKAAEARINRSR